MVEKIHGKQQSHRRWSAMTKSYYNNNMWGRYAIAPNLGRVGYAELMPSSVQKNRYRVIFYIKWKQD